ncbi:GntR family transcriptional regulator [Streptomyces sparsogenes]|uniref:GntR family transcriptional regulator n=1 Tax=Streptomyces sparsogenes TaxID=67365 RepID=UPI0033CA608A
MAEARHRRIATDMQRRIDSGEWTPGQQVPSRTDLALEYGVHEQTVRLAVTLLRRQGALEGEARKRLTVAYPPAVRALTNPDGDWPFGYEISGAGRCRATAELASRLDTPLHSVLQWEMRECWDPGGRSAMLITRWWRGRRRKHSSAIFEVDAVQLDAGQAQALRLPIDTVAYRLARTRLDAAGRPVEASDLILPMDRWVLRFGPRPQGQDRTGRWA